MTQGFHRHDSATAVASAPYPPELNLKEILAQQNFAGTLDAIRRQIGLSIDDFAGYVQLHSDGELTFEPPIYRQCCRGKTLGFDKAKALEELLRAPGIFTRFYHDRKYVGTPNQNIQAHASNPSYQ
jgi:hypothetical protein